MAIMHFNPIPLQNSIYILRKQFFSAASTTLDQLNVT